MTSAGLKRIVQACVGKCNITKETPRRSWSLRRGDQKYSMRTEGAEGHFEHFYFSLNAKYLS